MPDAADLEKRMEALGISDGSHVVVAYGKDRLPPAARVMFTLEAAGLGDRASLLDGGLPAWEAAGKPVTAEATPARTGALAPIKLRPLIVDAAFVQSHLAAPGYSVVDARAKAFYDGAQAGGSAAGPQPKGHVKNARSVPFTSISDPTGAIKTPAQLAALFKEAGVKPGDEVIAYCHVGQQATVVLLGAKLAGVKAVLYDGSYQDWSAKGLPVDGPAN
jgi:thiosulfate/3-mercaptopyruvate sulfurtransferase